MEENHNLKQDAAKEEIEFEDVLTDVGEYGKYQKRLIYLFLLPLILVGSTQMLNIFFIFSSPDFKCTHQNIQSNISEINYSSLNISDIANNITDIDQCYVDINKTAKCMTFVYDKTYYDETAVTYYDLVCERSHIKSLILSLHSVGDVIGDLLLGYLSDKIGRHKVFFICVTIATLSSISPLIFRGLVIFAICRLTNGIANAALFNLPYIALTELIGPKDRISVMWVTATCWTAAMCIIPFFAWASGDWIMLVLIPTLLTLPFYGYWSFFPESPRWLVSKGRYIEAFEILKMIAKVNGKKIDSIDLLEKVKSVETDETKEDADEVKSRPPIMSMITLSGLRMKFLILTLGWISCSAVYGGLTLSYENFHGNEFINWFLLSVVEFPANWLGCYLMETRLGRRWTYVVTMVAGGIFLCLSIFLPKSVIIVVSMAGKFLINISFNTIYQQTAELFPTPIRHSGLAYVSAISTGATLALPYLTALGAVAIWIPLSVIGSLAFLSGLVGSLLPETLNKNLPQTIKDGNDFGMNDKYLCLAKVIKEK